MYLTPNTAPLSESPAHLLLAKYVPLSPWPPDTPPPVFVNCFPFIFPPHVSNPRTQTNHDTFCHNLFSQNVEQSLP